jgi:hypothetical protein
MVAALVQTVTVVGHSYAGFVITNAGYNNPNVTELVHIATFALDEGQLLLNFNRYLSCRANELGDPVLVLLFISSAEEFAPLSICFFSSF